jgi:hypothetical protein
MAAWLAQRGHTVNVATVRKHARRIGALRAPGPRRFTAIDKMLKPDDRQPFEDLVGDPRVRTQDAIDWLCRRGYRRVHPQTVEKHRARVLDRLDAVARSARFARAMVQFVRAQGTAVVSDGMLTKLEQLLLEQLSRLESENKLQPHDLVDLTKSVTGAVTGRDTFEAMRRELEEAMRKAAVAGETAARQGATAKDVVARMRQIMGV